MPLFDSGIDHGKTQVNCFQNTESIKMPSFKLTAPCLNALLSSALHLPMPRSFHVRRAGSTLLEIPSILEVTLKT